MSTLFSFCWKCQTESFMCTQKNKCTGCNALLCPNCISGDNCPNKEIHFQPWMPHYILKTHGICKFCQRLVSFSKMKKCSLCFTQFCEFCLGGNIFFDLVACPDCF